MEIVKKVRGFTLIEILVVIGIIAILAAIVIIAINPAKQFAQARNAQRESNVSTLLNAIGQNIADNKGLFSCGSVTLPTSTTPIGTNGVNLKGCLVPTYIPTDLPKDPGGTVNGRSEDPGTDTNTGYTVFVDAVGRVQVCAPNYDEDAIPSISAAYCLTR